MASFIRSTQLVKILRLGLTFEQHKKAENKFWICITIISISLTHFSDPFWIHYPQFAFLSISKSLSLTLSLSLSLSSECGVQIANSCLASYQDHFGTLQEFIIHFNCCADWKVCALESDIFVNNSVQIKPRLRPYYFLLRSKDCMLETYMILAKVGV